MLDGDKNTKWCDVQQIPSYVTFDLKEPKTINGWSIMNAGKESASYVTVSCLLQAKDNENDEWKTIDTVLGNKRNVVNKKLSTPVSARYLRLLVVQPEQSPRGKDTRIYELSVY